RCCLAPLVIFFFQAEDGIRDFHVTGVQTCALPIWASRALTGAWIETDSTQSAHSCSSGRALTGAWIETIPRRAAGSPSGSRPHRSEERRVGKECRARESR